MRVKETLAIMIGVALIYTVSIETIGTEVTYFVGERAVYGTASKDPFNSDIYYMNDGNSKIYFQRNNLVPPDQADHCVIFDVELSYQKKNEAERKITYLYRENRALDRQSCQLINQDQNSYRQPEQSINE